MIVPRGMLHCFNLTYSCRRTTCRGKHKLLLKRMRIRVRNNCGTSLESSSSIACEHFVATFPLPFCSPLSPAIIWEWDWNLFDRKTTTHADRKNADARVQTPSSLLFFFSFSALVFFSRNRRRFSLKWKWRRRRLTDGKKEGKE